MPIGTVLMRPVLPTKCSAADVAGPQQASLGRRGCHFPKKSAIVCAGRTQAVFLSKRGLMGKLSPTFQEYWSRGCLRARVLFSHFAWWPLCLPVPRKKKKSYLLKSQFRLSQPIPANTSNLSRRVGQGDLARHATSDPRRPSGMSEPDVFSGAGRYGRPSGGDGAMIKTAAVSLIRVRRSC